MADQTCEIQPAGGRLPDPGQLAAGVAAMGVGARLRGIEATIDGSLVETDGNLVLQISGTGDRVRLVPLTRKVQLNKTGKREASISHAERTAWRRLRASAGRQAEVVRVIGPLVAGVEGGPLQLEVRSFAWRQP